MTSVGDHTCTRPYKLRSIQYNSINSPFIQRDWSLCIKGLLIRLQDHQFENYHPGYWYQVLFPNKFLPKGVIEAACMCIWTDKELVRLNLEVCSTRKPDGK